jgi:hypothetical protein
MGDEGDLTYFLFLEVISKFNSECVLTGRFLTY